VPSEVDSIMYRALHRSFISSFLFSSPKVHEYFLSALFGSDFFSVARVVRYLSRTIFKRYRVWAAYTDSFYNLYFDPC